MWVTFDDACRDFGEIAWPILRRHGVPATVFVPTAYPDHPELRFWWDRLYSALSGTSTRGGAGSGFRAAAARDGGSATVEPSAGAAAGQGDAADRGDAGGRSPLRSAWIHGPRRWRRAELERVAAADVAGCVGRRPHPAPHPALTRMWVDARREIRGSRDDLQRELGAWLPVLASIPSAITTTPSSAWRARRIQLAAVTCHDGHDGQSADPLRLRRTNITRRTGQVAFRARLTSIGARVDRWRHRHERDEGPRPRAAAAGHRAGPPLKLAYIMSRFPKLSETFILNELLTANTLGVPIGIYPLIRERQRVMHPEVEAWVRRARFQRLFSPGLLLAHAHYMVRQPIGSRRPGCRSAASHVGQPQVLHRGA